MLATKRYPLGVFIHLLFLLSGSVAFSQMRQVFVDPAAPENEILKMSFYSPSQGYVAFENSVGYSTDSGRTFIRKYVSMGNVNYNGYSVNLTFGFTVNGVKALAQNNLLLYGDYGLVPAILRSVDGGNTFTLVFHSQYNQFQLSTGITDMIFPQNDNTGYAVDADRVLKTTNGGQSWAAVRISPNSFFDRLEAVDNLRVYAMSLSYTHNSVEYTNGSSWFQLNTPYVYESRINYVFFLNANVGWIGLTDANYKQYFYKTTNTGATWTLQNNPDITPFSSGKFKFTDANTGYALAGQNTVYKTENSGALWEPLKRDNNYAYLGFGFNDLHFISPNQFWAGGSHIELTTNAGGPTLPKAFFKVDTAGVAQTNTVNLINFSKNTYSFQWFVNGSSIGNTYNASYIHDAFKLRDTIQLVVSNGSESDTLVKYQDFHPPVVVNSFTPAAAGAGTQVMITGNNFNEVQSVTFGNIAATSFAVLSSNSISAFVSSNGASGNVEVRTTTGAGLKAGFTFLPPPTITSFSPTTATAGTVIAITGTNFTGATDVRFSGVAASYTVVSPTQITAIAPSGASGSITVVTPGGMASLGGFVASPVINSFSPAKGTQGTVMVIKGTSLAGVTAVSIGGVAAQSFVVHNADSITAIVHTGASGTVNIIAPGGSSALAGFTWVAPPVISSFSAASGPVGTTVNITGTGFNNVPQNNIVYFGTLRATIIGGSSNSIAVIVPAGANFETISVINNDLVAYAVYPFMVTFPNGGSISDNSFINPFVYTNPQNYYVNVKVADLDNDGKPDLLFSNNNVSNGALSGTLIYKNTSTISTVSFAAPLLITGGYTSLGTGDLDADGMTDLVITSGNDNIDIYRNTSSGGNLSFLKLLSIPCPPTPSDIAIADIDADGKADIVTGGYPAGVAVVYRNITNPGKLAFAPRVEFEAGGGSNIILADITGDGKPEIILPDATGSASYILKNTCSINTISFATAVIIEGYSYAHMALADFDADGKPDLVTADQEGSRLYFLKNTGSGNSIDFAPGIQSGYVQQPGGLVTGDFDGDGKPDVATTEWNSSLAVFKNTSGPGNIAMSAPKVYGPATTFGGHTLAAGDMDGDGKADIITIAPGQRSFYVHLNKVVAEPFIESFIPTIGAAGTSVTITGANFTGSTSVNFGGAPAGSFTVLSPTSISAVVGAGGTGAVSVTNNLGTSTKPGFVYGIPPQIISISSTSGPVGTAIILNGTNFNPVPANNIVYFGTMRATVTSATNTALTILIPAGPTHEFFSVTVNNLTGYSSQYFNVTFPGAGNTLTSGNFAERRNGPNYSRGTCDIDGDGKLDFISAAGASNIAVSLNTSTPSNISFAAKVQFTGPYLFTGLSCADLDGDGKQDIVTFNYDQSTITIWKNNSSTGLVSLVLVGSYPTGISTSRPNDIAIRDLDGDGKPEIAVANYYSQSLAIFNNKSTGGQISFSVADRIIYSLAGYPTGIVLRDIDGDNKPDIVLSVNSSNTAGVFRNKSVPGNLSFENLRQSGAGDWPSDLECADMDGDGKPEILTVNINGGDLSTFKNESVPGNIAMAAAAPTSAGAGPGRIVVGDLDGDGKPDVLINNRYQPEGISIFKNTGSANNIGLSQRFFMNITDGPVPGIADIDGDGAADLLVYNSTAGGVFIYRNMTGIPVVANSICPNGSVSITSSVTSTAYQWQRDAGQGFVNISNGTNYAGVSTATLQVSNIPTSWYGYKFRCVTLTATSSSTEIKFVNQWTGAANNLWGNPANWACGVVPDGNTDVVINNGTVVLNVPGTCRSISLATGVSFTVTGGNILTITH